MIPYCAACAPWLMLGVFDSGRGGRHALAALRAQLPYADIAFFADTANAPYGTKSQADLLPLVEKDIRRLRHAGARYILCACCTASCLLPELPSSLRADVFPILIPTAEAAAYATENHRYMLLATQATVNSGALADAVYQKDPDADIVCRAAPGLVTLAEADRKTLCDSAVRRALLPFLRQARKQEIDTLILGCTHFSSFRSLFSDALPGVHVIGSAEEGAYAFAKQLPDSARHGCGRTVYL